MGIIGILLLSGIYIQQLSRAVSLSVLTCRLLEHFWSEVQILSTAGLTLGLLSIGIKVDLLVWLLETDGYVGINISKSKGLTK